MAEIYNKPNGLCAQCGAPLNEYMVGGYKLHNNDHPNVVNAFINMPKEMCLDYRNKINGRFKKIEKE